MNTQTSGLTKISAVVVGLCSHGLSICRALSRRNVRVFALEANSNLAGTKTNSATVIQTSSINDESLISSLIEFSAKIDHKPALFLTNDKMVELVSANWQRLKEHYLLSWSEAPEIVQRLQLKSELAAWCHDRNISHPETLTINSSQDTQGIDALPFPMIVKPVQPMSSFKVKLVQNQTELLNLIEEHQSALPFVAQQWIDGSDDKLVFCSMVLDKGEVSSFFTGRKLLAHPPTLGQGLVMEPFAEQTAKQLSADFFKGSNYSGPASIEFKIDAQGVYWLIEPNMGRTEYSVECAIGNQVDLVVDEYDLVTQSPRSETTQSNNYIWFDTEKDIFCYARLVVAQKSWKINGKKPIFPFLSNKDLSPFFHAFKAKVVQTLTKRKKK